MARITVEDCIDKFESRFELVLVASNRARKLHSGENPTIDKDNDKNTVIALREIADESIQIQDMKNSLIEEYQSVSMQNEEDLPLGYSDSEETQEDSVDAKILDDSVKTNELNSFDSEEEVTSNETQDSNQDIENNHVSTEENLKKDEI